MSAPASATEAEALLLLFQFEKLLLHGKYFMYAILGEYNRH